MQNYNLPQLDMAAAYRNHNGKTYDRLKKNGLIPEKQKRSRMPEEHKESRKKCKGTKDPLAIDIRIS